MQSESLAVHDVVTPELDDDLHDCMRGSTLLTVQRISAANSLTLATPERRAHAIFVSFHVVSVSGRAFGSRRPAGLAPINAVAKSGRGVDCRAARHEPETTMMHHRFFSLGIGMASALISGASLAQAPAPPAAPAAPTAAPAPAGAPPAAPPSEAPPGAVPVQPGPPPSAPPASGSAPYYEQSAPPQNPPRIYVEQPPPAPLEPRTRHYHDGFYLRLSTGLGIEGVSSSAGDSKASTSGAGFALDLLVGGTPVPGLVIGGGLLGQSAVSPSQSNDQGPPLAGINDHPGGGVGLVLLGPFIDVFPNPSDGFHLGALLGGAAIGLKGSDDKLSTGGGLSAWVGYGWWAASDWSLGGLMRLSAAGTKRTVDGVDVSDGAWGLTFEFSAAYH